MNDSKGRASTSWEAARSNISSTHFHTRSACCQCNTVHSEILGVDGGDTPLDGCHQLFRKNERLPELPGSATVKQARTAADDVPCWTTKVVCLQEEVQLPAAIEGGQYQPEGGEWRFSACLGVKRVTSMLPMGKTVGYGSKAETSL